MGKKFLTLHEGRNTLEDFAAIADRYLVFVVSHQLMRQGLIPIVCECPFPGIIKNIKAAAFTPATTSPIAFNVEATIPVTLNQDILASLTLPIGATAVSQSLDINVLPGTLFNLNMLQTVVDAVGSINVTITIQLN